MDAQGNIHNLKDLTLEEFEELTRREELVMIPPAQITEIQAMTKKERRRWYKEHQK